MIVQEALMLLRWVQAACPQQAIDEYTPDTWADLLDDVPYDDARAAARTVARRQPFVSPAEIITEVRRIRAERIRVHDEPVPPAGLTPRESATWLLEARRRIGNGEVLVDDQRGELVDRDVIGVLTTAAPRVA